MAARQQLAVENEAKKYLMNEGILVQVDNKLVFATLLSESIEE